MSTDSLTHTEQFRVRAYETGPGTTATLQHIANYLQETASTHAMKLGFGFDDMTAHNCAWFLSRLRMFVTRPPAWGETVTVTTWPSTPDRMLAHREYAMTDADGKLVCRATSAWAIFDLERQRPAPVPDWMGSDKWSGERGLELPKKKPVPPAQDGDCMERTLAVRYADTDMNHHANHTAYISWIMEPLPQDMIAAQRPELLDIVYRAPCMWGETVTSRVLHTDATTCAHAVLRDGQELVRATTVWRQR